MGKSSERVETASSLQRAEAFGTKPLCSLPLGLRTLILQSALSRLRHRCGPFPPNPSGNIEPKIALRRLNEAKTTLIISWTKERQATVNDALLTAFYRSLAHRAVYALPCTETRAIGLTVDLRRYLPGQTSGAISNLSAVEVPVIELHDGES
ncbi:hypothetical protein M7775_14640 [Sporomusa sphaeroides DSM 2875]|uniref:hypothetical protein n=1 Tax=Sporomusa sphaeroides TaxID=47679 RepID=UPI0020307958|nr:hypothetical protein [Sporomusa sphaeroides]MCM0759795.1 hypothetical protein [Sporomusa sphaeroides DSM 2875]